jgi:hypothetical protein
MPNLIYLGNPITDEIRGRKFADNLGVACTGSLTSRVYDFAPVPPTVPFFSGLFSEKSAALLRAFPAFTDITGEDFSLPPFGVNTTDSISAKAGYNEVSVAVNGQYVSNSYTLPYIPTQAMLVWDAYTYIEAHPPGGDYTKKYLEVSDTDPNLRVEVDFLGVLPSFIVTNRTPFVIPAPPGDQFVVRFSNIGFFPENVRVGSWFLLYRA